MTLRTRRRALAGVLAAAAALAIAAAPAGASSIVYVKDGNVWLSDPGGAKQYQVTFDGGYLSPSQADDGTIVAWRAKQFVRMDRSGRVLNPPVDGIGRDDGNGQFYGPLGAQGVARRPPRRVLVRPVLQLLQLRLLLLPLPPREQVDVDLGRPFQAVLRGRLL